MRHLLDAERKWPVREQEAFGIVWGILYFNQYLNGAQFTVRTDHQSLRWLWNTDNKRIARWALALEDSLNDRISFAAENLRRALLYYYHFSRVGGHQGVTRTFNRVSKVLCMRRRMPTSVATAGNLIADGPGVMVAIDIVGPMHHRGKEYKRLEEVIHEVDFQLGVSLLPTNGQRYTIHFNGLYRTMSKFGDTQDIRKSVSPAREWSGGGVSSILPEDTVCIHKSNELGHEGSVSHCTDGVSVNTTPYNWRGAPYPTDRR